MTAPAAPELKLQMDLIPKACWGRSLRKAIPKSRWDRLRKEVCATAEYRCQVCGSEPEPGKLHCHEDWEYDDNNLIQTLVGLRAICNMCHFVEHYGQAQKLARGGHLNLGAVDEHFLRVNGVSEEDLLSHKEYTRDLWRQRSEHEWRTDFGEWASLLPGAGPDRKT